MSSNKSKGNGKMKKLTVYNNYYKDEVMATYDLNTIDAIALSDSLLRSGLDILITNVENINEVK